MNERDDYLLDPKASPDADVQALEQALAPLRWTGAPLRDDAAPPPRATPRQRRPWFALVAAAAAAVLALFFLLRDGDDAALREGSAGRRFVAAKTPLVIPLGDFAEVTLRPGSELAFVHWQQDQLLLALARGGLEAKVAAPPKVQPGFFAVDTPLGRVVDQGCRYSLDLVDGIAIVKVAQGAVEFAAPRRTVFVPAGASVRVRPGGADTPCFDDAEPELKKALAEYDATRDVATKDREMAVKMVLAAARAPADSLVLWHLLFDADIADVAEDHLRRLVGPPDGGKTKRDSFEPDEWLAHLRLAAWQR